MQLLPKKCWNILEKNHVGDEITNMKRQFELLLVEPSENIAEYFNSYSTQQSNKKL
jgi:hypothetical protein